MYYECKISDYSLYLVFHIQYHILQSTMNDYILSYSVYRKVSLTYLQSEENKPFLFHILYEFILGK